MSECVRTCRKCGTELPQDYRYDMCDNCRREKAGLFRKIGMGIVGAFGLVLAVGQAANQINSKKEEDENEEV